MYSLHRFLVDYDIGMLRALAQCRGVALVTNRQTEAADQLAAALLEPLSVRTALARLSPEGREALDVLLAAGGRLRAPHYARRFGQMRPIGSGRLEREAPWQKPVNAAEELWYAGFIFRAFAEDEAGAGEFVFVPTDLLPLLPQPPGGPPEFAVQTVAAPPHPGDDAPALVHDLFAYLVVLQTHDLRSYADGRLGRRDLAIVQGRLTDPDEQRFALLRHLADRLGFVMRQDEHLRPNAAPVKRWLVASPGHQLLALQDAWRVDPSWNDLCHVPNLVCDQQTGWHLQYDPVATRRAFLALLARCPQNAWWSLTSFVQAVKEAHPDFQRPDGDYTNWYIRGAEGGDYLSGFESWERVEGALITDLLTRTLRWLGVVSTAVDESGPGQDRGTICCLTRAGMRFLGLLSDEPADLPSPPIVVRPDFDIEVPAPANLYTRFQLERFADLTSKEPCHYTLTVSALGRALARDIRVEQVLAFLQQASEAPVPANVAGQLRLWAGRFGQVQLEEVALLRVKNERILKELAVLPETRSLISEVVSPTSALIRRQDLPRLRKALHSLGFLASPPGEAAGDPVKRG